MKETTKKSKQEIIKDFAINKNDTGSAEIQIASLTNQINHLISHLKENKKDHATRNGLLEMVGRRKRFIKYLSKKKPEEFVKLAKKLNLKIEKK